MQAGTPKAQRSRAGPLAAYATRIPQRYRRSSSRGIAVRAKGAPHTRETPASATLRGEKGAKPLYNAAWPEKAPSVPLLWEAGSVILGPGYELLPDPLEARALVLRAGHLQRHRVWVLLPARPAKAALHVEQLPLLFKLLLFPVAE
eukprot:934764-Pyramimonas_sp.AAC.1